MMKEVTAGLIAGAIMFTPAMAAAQNASADTVASERAEHAHWEADIAKWEQEHAAVADGLIKLSEYLRSSEASLARYDRKVEEHAALLHGKTAERGEVLARHEAMRSAYDEMRQTHARLMQAYEQLKLTIYSDDDTGKVR